jgi:hypothetical protein
MIDKKLQEYYESRFSMMSTQGWQDLVEDAQNMFNSLNHVLSIQSEADLMVKKGQLDLLQWLITLKPASEQAYEQLINDSAGAAQNE